VRTGAQLEGGALYGCPGQQAVSKGRENGRYKKYFKLKKIIFSAQQTKLFIQMTANSIHNFDVFN
jgi:hypothetical protein